MEIFYSKSLDFIGLIRAYIVKSILFSYTHGKKTTKSLWGNECKLKKLMDRKIF